MRQRHMAEPSTGQPVGGGKGHAMKTKKQTKNGKRKQLADLPTRKEEATRVKGGVGPIDGVKATGSTALPIGPIDGAR